MFQDGWIETVYGQDPRIHLWSPQSGTTPINSRYVIKTHEPKLDPSLPPHRLNLTRPPGSILTRLLALTFHRITESQCMQSQWRYRSQTHPGRCTHINQATQLLWRPDPTVSIPYLLAVSSTFDSLFKVLFTFPLRYLWTIGLPCIFSFGWNLPPVKAAVPNNPTLGWQLVHGRLSI